MTHVMSREEMLAFTRGKRYKRLLHEMKVGMRTHNDKERLRLKSEARKERRKIHKEERKKLKRKRQRAKGGGSAEDIDAKKAAFQAKKARRLARKAEAAKAAT